MTNFQRFKISKPDSQSNESVRCWSDFTTLKQSPIWEKILPHGSSIFETVGWHENLRATCPDGSSLLLLTQEDDSGASLLPLRKYKNSKLQANSNFYASIFGLVCKDDTQAATHAAAYSRWIRLSGISTLRLHPIDRESVFAQALVQHLRSQGFWVDTYFAFGNWIYPSKSIKWPEYLASRPSRLRNTIQRLRKKLDRRADFHAKFCNENSESHDVDVATLDFCKVYNSSWKKPEPFPNFVPTLCRWAHQQGWLRLGVCYFGQDPVAAQIWFVRDGIASIFKLAYDEKYAKDGVGTWLSAAMTEHALDKDKVSEIDFLTGDDAYKAEWMSQRRERHGLIAFNPRSARGLLAAARHYGARLLRHSAHRGHWQGRKAD